MSRILFIITQSEIGGAQRYLLELAPYLTQKGHEIIVAAGEGDGELFDRLDSTGSDPAEFSGVRPLHIKVPSLIRNLHPIKDLKALFALYKIIKKEKPDILFLQSTKAGFLGSLAVKLSALIRVGRPYAAPIRINPRVIYRIGGWTFRDPRPWWINRILFWMEKISARWKNVIIVNSEFDRKIAIDKKVAPSEKVVKIYNGINPSSLNFLPKEEALRSIGYRVWGMEGKTVLVGTIANLYATKGIEYLIEAAHLLSPIPHTLPPILFVVIGEGRERPRLEALIKNCNLQDKFFLVGRIPNASQCLKAFDIFVLPSTKEGFPWVILEAMAAEVPIVATKVGAVPEVIEDEREGLLVPPKNSQALAKKIHKLIIAQIPIHYSHDRGNSVQRQILAKNALGKLKQFSLQKMLRESERAIFNF